MRVHHLCCLTMCPPLAPLVDGGHRWLSRGTLICHCLLIETPKDGLVLVDTAIGLQDCRDPRGRLGLAFASLIIPRHPPEEDTAIRQIQRLGYQPSDVRHIIVTHLDVDHAGGLADFPHASVHLMQDERDAALSPRTFNESHRYRASHFAHGPRWVVYGTQGERWRKFEAVRQLEGLPPEILLVPLPGHTRGHTAVAVEAPGGPLLHCGDAYFHGGTVDPSRGKVPVGLRVFERSMALDRQHVRENHARLRELRAGGEVRLFCAHDPHELRSDAAGAAPPDRVG
jgi:glyoxylase-like metal-dependent hydrolase (beta-lactamase superfamily II)